jgi:hypothetical protein
LPRTSELAALVAGKKYAFQVLWKEGGGGDFAQVAMRKEGDAAAGALPDRGVVLLDFPDPNHGRPLIQTSPPVTVAAGASTTFSVTALGPALELPVVVRRWMSREPPRPPTIASAGASNRPYSVRVS